MGSSAPSRVDGERGGGGIAGGGVEALDEGDFGEGAGAVGGFGFEEEPVDGAVDGGGLDFLGDDFGAVDFPGGAREVGADFVAGLVEEVGAGGL